MTYDCTLPNQQPPEPPTAYPSIHTATVTETYQQQEASHSQIPRIPTVYIDNTAAVEDFFEEMKEHYPIGFGPNDRFKFTVRSGTVRNGAQIFISYLEHFTAKLLGIEQPPIDVDNHWGDAIETQPQSIAGLILPGQQSWK